MVLMNDYPVYTGPRSVEEFGTLLYPVVAGIKDKVELKKAINENPCFVKILCRTIL